jgi:hypothetical protein
MAVRASDGNAPDFSLFFRVTRKGIGLAQGHLKEKEGDEI